MATVLWFTNTWVKVVNEDQDDDDPAEYRYYYMQSSGKAYKAGDSSDVKFKTIDGKKYAFDDDGKMLYGWVKKDDANLATDDSDWEDAEYYLGSWEDGSMKTGWQKITVYDQDEDDDYDYWFNFKSNGEKRTRTDNNAKDKDIYEKKINGKYYGFDKRGVMTYEWTATTESDLSTISNWRYFNSPEDGARSTKGWFKVVAAEYLNKSKYDDDEDAWYYADGSGNIYAGEFKTIKGKKYAFRTDGRMINGLKFIQKDNNGKITDVKADDDDPNFDTEDDFINHAISFYLKNNYECYYFGGSEDGAMRTNKTNITIDGDNFNFYFEKSGSNKGAGLTGEKDDKYYLAGMLVKAGSDEKYQVVKKVTLSNGKVAYQKIADAKKFLDSVAHTTPSANSDGKVTIGGANTGAVTKKSDDLKEAYDITTPSADYFLVNTSGSVVDKKSKSKDGDDYVFVTGSKGVIIGVYVED